MHSDKAVSRLAHLLLALMRNTMTANEIEEILDNEPVGGCEDDPLYRFAETLAENYLDHEVTMQ